MFRLDRSQEAGDYLVWKVRIFTVGAVLAMVGMYREESWMTGAAILVLLLGFVLRFLPGMSNPGRGDGREGSDDAMESSDGGTPGGTPG